MAGRKLLHRSTGVVETPVERVRDLVLTVRPGPVSDTNGWLLTDLGETLSGGPQRFTLTIAGGTQTVELSADTLAIQGGWWYRGEWTVAVTGDGTQVTYRVYNVASKTRWLVPLANRFFFGFQEQQRQGFRDVLDRLSRA
ncbi:MAG: hypothetical protein GEV07_19185 [Streptosporangiales bacterium]|nr:hypothetical protein [Streptosporangiales bacterium]